MRKPLLSLFALFTFVLHSQNWNVFNENYRYNYKFNNSAIVTNVMFADSVYNSGSDIIYKMNRIGVECTGSCPTVTTALSQTVTYVVPNMPQFLQRNIRKYSSGIVMLLDTSKQVIIPTCSLTQTWLFDSILNINAICTSATVQNVFGQSDSVKTIIIGGNDSLVLSKSFGILKFPQPYNQNKYYRLVGIETKDSYDQTALYGEKVQNAWDFYNYEVGDLYCESYLQGSFNPDPQICYRKKVTILAKVLSGQIYTYTVSVYSKYNSSNFGGSCYYINQPGYPLTYSIETISFPDLSSPTLTCNYAYPNMISQENISPFANYSKFGLDNYGKFYKYSGNWCSLQLNITLPNTNAISFMAPTNGIFQTGQGDYYETWLYGETFGQIQGAGLYFEGDHQYCKTSFKRNGITYFGSEDPIGVKENNLSASNHFLSPNPASSEVQLQIFDDASLKIVNSVGEIIFSGRSGPTIDVSAFPIGIYLITIEKDSFKMSQKLIVEH
jgi:hypothetical protein